MDAVILKSGRRIPYLYDLTYDGIVAHVSKDNLTDAEREEFTSRLRSERDVVRIVWRKDARYCDECMASPCAQT